MAESPEFDLPNFPGRLIGRTAGLMSRYVNAEMEKHGVTLEQWIILAHLHQNDGLEQHQIAMLCAKTKGTITHLLDHLERRNLVYRRAHPQDRRIKQVFLTDKGHELKDKLIGTAHYCIDEMTDGMPQEDLETTYRTLRRIMERLQHICP